LGDLRTQPRLAFVSTRWDMQNGRPAQSANEFWTQFDGRKR